MLVSLGASAGVTNEIPAGPPISEDGGKGAVMSGTQNSNTLDWTGTHTDPDTGVTTALQTS
jgi:hypothetical protein